MRHRLVPAALCAAAVALGVSAGPAAAVPPTCDPQYEICEPVSYTESADRKLTVHAPVGTVTSPAGINCTAATCSKTVKVSRECLEDSCNDWPAATAITLTASGGPGGYSPAWSDCAGHGTCTVFLGDEGMGGAFEDVTLTWVDTTAPSVTFAPPAKVGPSGYSVSAGGNDNSGQAPSYQWTVDAAAQGTTGSVLSLQALANGKHTIAVRAVDQAGNVSGTVTKDVVVDKAVNVATSVLPAITNAATVPLTFTKDADVTKSECSLDGGAYAVCASGWSGVSAATADGKHTYRVRVTDDVGNVAESPLRETVVDRTQPVLAFIDGPAEGQQVVTRSAAITFSLTDAHPGSASCKLDGGTATACSPGAPVQLSGLADGTHTLTVTAVDTAGNSRAITRTFGVQVPVSTGDGGETPSGDGGGGETPAGGGGTPSGGGGGQTPAGGGTPPVTRGPAFAPRVSYNVVYKGRLTTFTRLVVTGLPKTAKLSVTCKGAGCAVKSKALKHAGGTLNVLKALKKLKLRAGASLTITVRGDGGAKLIGSFVIRAGKAPSARYRCAEAGGRLRAC